MSTARRGSRRSLFSALSSPVGRKVLTGVTGIVWVLFIIVHLIGNLGYFTPGDSYNLYSHFLLNTGPLILIAEALLVLTLLLHAYLGLMIYVGKKRARARGYAEYHTMGRPSLQTPSSRTMIFTGIVLLVFLVIHLWSFKFGPSIEQGYSVLVDGETIRDLKRLMTEKFQNPLYAFGYPAVMILLGFHLRHGIWSAFQSLGTMNARLTPLVYTLGTLLAILLAVGFLMIPLWIYFTA
jgi:succinate dehydrogenase / fumarate reductase cytochrome b subunit